MALTSLLANQVLTAADLSPLPDSEHVPIYPSLPTIEPDSSAFSDLNLLIALHKGKLSSTMHPILYFVSYDRLILLSRQFAMSISFVSIPKSYQDAVMYTEWKHIDEEIDALLSRQTWDFVPTSSRLSIVSCRWVFTVKYHPMT